MSVELISPEELSRVLKNNTGAILIDVRTPGEFESVHISGARNLPLGSKELSDFINTHRGTKETIYVTCQKGGRAKTACTDFARENITTKSLSGGMDAWIEAKLPVNQGKKTLSIERQVRIIAGALVVLGVLLHYAGLPNAILLSGFVGAGLTFAGVTDTCGMAFALARMPWNQVSKNSKKSCC